jgi:hypothetical protein
VTRTIMHHSGMYSGIVGISMGKEECWWTKVKGNRGSESEGLRRVVDDDANMLAALSSLISDLTSESLHFVLATIKRGCLSGRGICRLADLMKGRFWRATQAEYSQSDEAAWGINDLRK